MLKYFKENILKPTNEMCELAGLESVPDEPYEEQRDDERTEDYPLGGMLEPYDIEGDR